MHECSRRQDHALNSVSFNTVRYVPRLLEGFVGFPEPFLVEELYPFFQRLLLVNSLRRSIQEPYADYFERTLSEQSLPLLQLLLVIGEYIELNCLSAYPAVASALTGTNDFPDTSGALLNISVREFLFVAVSEEIPRQRCSTW